MVGTKSTMEDMYPERQILKITDSPFVNLQSPGDHDSIKQGVANALYGRLPAPIDRKAKNLALATDMDAHESREDYVGRVTKLVTEQLMPMRMSQRLALLDKEAALALIAVLACSIASGLIVLGCWQRLLVNY